MATRRLTFGEWLRETREHHGLTQRQLAALTDGEISFTQIAKLETSLRSPGLRALRGVAAAFGCTFSIHPDGSLHINGTELDLP